MGPTILFTQLKIILLQCFQFSVFNFQFSATISLIQTDLIFLGAFMASFFFFLFFLHIKLNNNDLTTTATNTSWPPALLLRIPFSRKKRILLSRKISCFLFCPYFERERERESSTLLDSVYCIDIFGCI